MLEVEGLTSHYGRIQALKGVAINVEAGELVAVVGSNGAGKTTLPRTISGVQPASGGRVRFSGEDITAMAPHHRVRRGIVQVPEGRQVFGTLTVEDNLRLGAVTRKDADLESEIEADREFMRTGKRSIIHPAPHAPRQESTTIPIGEGDRFARGCKVPRGLGVDDRDALEHAGPSHSRRDLVAQIATLNEKIAGLSSDKMLLMDRCEAAQAASAVHAQGERDERLAREKLEREMRELRQKYEGLKSKYKVLKAT